MPAVALKTREEALQWAGRWLMEAESYSKADRKPADAEIEVQFALAQVAYAIKKAKVLK